MRTITSRMALLACLAVAAIACDNGKPAAGVASATASSTTTAKPKTPPKPVLKPKALDVPALQKSLKCGAGGRGACAVLSALANCKPWAQRSPDMRWMGEAFVVKGGVPSQAVALMRARRVGTADVSPGQLPFKLAVEPLAADREVENTHAKKAIREFKRGDVARPTNQAVRYAKDKATWSESFAMQAEQNQIYLANTGGGFLCLLADRRVVVVDHAGNKTQPADGLYAIMWPVSW